MSTYEAPRTVELMDCALDPTTVRPFEVSRVVALHRDCDPNECALLRDQVVYPSDGVEG